MIKFVRTLLITVLLFIPLLSMCQIATPKWVDDIGGPTSNCISSAVKVDKQNNVYVAGFYDGTADFDPSAGVYNLTASGGGFDIFVAKYTSAGALIWAKSFGGDGTDQVNSMTVDINGNPIISGQYNSTSINFGSATIQNGGDWDAFVIKLNTNGGFVWAKSVGGSSTDYGAHVASDSQGNIVQCLRFESSFSLGGKSYSSTSGSFNALTVKYDPNGNVLWAINLPDATRSESIFSEFDSQNNTVVCGHFESNDNFNPLGTAYNLNGNGNSTYIAKYSPSGILIWVKSFTGTVVGDNTNLCINSKDDIYIDGPFTSQMNFGTVTLNPSGSQDIFLSKYSSAGVFQSVNDVGGSGGSIFNYGIVCSKDDYVYVSGYFSGTIDFDPSATSNALVSDHGLQDFFLAKYDSNLNYKWAFNGGNNSCSQNLGRNVAIDNNNDVLYTGGFCSTVNFSASACTPVIRTAQSGSRDCFLAKYTQSVASAQAQITGFSIPQQSSPAVIDQTNLIITVTVPAGTNVKALVPTVAYTSGVTLAPVSGAAQDFTNAVTYTLSANCSSLNYTVNVVFAAGAIPQAEYVCSGDVATWYGEIKTSTPTSYLWQISQNNVWASAPGTNNEVNYTTPVLNNNTGAAIIYNYRRQVIIQGVTSYDSYFDVTINAAILNNTIIAPAVIAFCSNGDPSSITGSTPTGGLATYPYQWQSSTDNTTFVNINGAIAKDYDPSAISSTTYYRRMITSGQCPSYSNTVTITISPTPATPVSTAAAVSICTGSGVGLSVSNPQAGVTYNWYDSPAKTTLLHTGTNYTTGLLTSNTTYYIEATNGSCTSTSLATVQVTVVALPSAPALATNSVSTCYGSSLTLTDDAPQDGHYNWYTVPTGGTAVGSGVTFVTGALTQNTTYYVENVNTTGCISATRTKFDITVIPLPAAPQIQTPLPVCSGTASTLNIATPQAGLTYNWYAAATGGTLLGTGTSYKQTDLTDNTYYAEAVNANSCTSASRTQVIITPIDLPVAPQASSPAGICSGSTATLAVTSPQANLTYNWYAAATGGTLLASGNSYTTSALATSTTYYVEAMSNIGGCTSITRTAVQVNVTQPPVTPTPVSPTVSVCSGSTTSLSINNPQTGVVYNWYDSATKTNLLFTGPSYTIKLINANTTFYIEAVNGPCTTPSMGSVQVNVIALPVTPAVVKSPVSICSGTQASLSVASPQSGITYNWYNTATGGTSVFTGTDFSTPQLSSSTTYYVEAVNSNSCTSAVRTAASVIVTPTPGIITQNISICPGTSSTIVASSSDPDATISWYTSNASTTPLATGSNFKTPVLNNNAIYYAEAVNNTTGCISVTRSIATVTMYQQLAAPVVTVGGTTVTTVTFSWGAVDGASGYQVSMDGGVTFNTPSSGTSGLTHTITGLKLGESVTIMVEATGASTCQLSGSSTAVTGVAHNSVHDLIYVANAFTPNGDGVNDVVYVHSEEIKSLNFYVYDQWGEMLFKSTSQSVGWDGTYKGTKQPVGVYVYYVQAVMNDGQQVTKKGTITLLK
ncbi:gliding motility-associated C-terminal domain-containing protein [Mucilaginibacter mallensis]|uniref:Gliding motility-associated C-terminal domain-containing protein n=1 Tax=Mucilaginibacter mallensis TaxID=652787 RepID=A0A1H1NHA6_MUCMA|nr:gliding motility-associated C-terminal domain-containing protein [Mucilaginibacter mallensis]SDR98220.1 gliding motility-associated C-terminal domain-containing protein [Mucilaginibacter mallensis]